MDGSGNISKIALRTNELDMAKGHCRINEWSRTEAVLGMLNHSSWYTLTQGMCGYRSFDIQERVAIVCLIVC